MKRVIITTSNNLVMDNRVFKVSGSLQNMGFEVWQSGRNFPRQPLPNGRVGRSFRFSLIFNKGPLFYLCLNLRLVFFLLGHRASLIWAVDMDTLPACRIAGLLKNVPVVFDSHEFFSEVPELHHRPLKKRIWCLMERFLIPGTSMRFTVSPGLVELYQKRYSIGFDLLRNLPLRKKNVFEGTRGSINTRTVFYQGALNMGRGLEQTIRAMLYLPDYKFIIMGRGDSMNSLRSLTKELNLENQVVFKGAVPFEQLPELTHNAMAGMCLLEDMGLNYYHSLPNRIFDHMQQGIPVIASDFPDIREVVERHQTGLLVGELSPELIAATIKRACEDTALREIWRKTIQEAANHFIWQNEEKIIRERVGEFLEEHKKTF